MNATNSQASRSADVCDALLAYALDTRDWRCGPAFLFGRTEAAKVAQIIKVVRRTSKLTIDESQAASYLQWLEPAYGRALDKILDAQIG